MQANENQDGLAVPTPVVQPVDVKETPCFISTGNNDLVGGLYDGIGEPELQFAPSVMDIAKAHHQ